jgi:GT2 family glycosyltransferase
MSGGATTSATPAVTAVVPTLGRSRWLKACLEALRREGGDGIEIVVVAQGEGVDDATCNASCNASCNAADRVLRLPTPAGFARATNLGVAAARGELVATVNDDAVVEEGWLAALTAALAADPKAAAAQGVQLLPGEPARIDGCGVGWNRWWQAVQIGHGRPVEELEEVVGGAGDPIEIFGVSATAALYRREALAAVAGPEGVFDERLFAYYEDVDLAARLRAAGHRALLVPSARALHAGSTTGRGMAWGSRQLIGGNRHLVLARLLGRGYWWRLPWLLLRDLADLARAVLGGDGRAAAGIVAGVARAARHLPGFARLGAPAVSVGELRRFRVDRRGGGSAKIRA